MKLLSLLSLEVGNPWKHILALLYHKLRLKRGSYPICISYMSEFIHLQQFYRYNHLYLGARIPKMVYWNI